MSHGCTGKGNDQVRFEVGIGALAPHLKVIAPARDYAWTRDKAIAYAEEKNLPIDVTHKSPYSIDQNLWGRAVETGFLEDIWNAPDRGPVLVHPGPGHAAGRRTRSSITFDARRAGRDRRRDGHPVPGHRGAQPARRRARASAGWTWSRTGWSASRAARSTRRPARSRSSPPTRSWRTSPSSGTWPGSSAGVDQRWGELVYDGLWFSPLKQALDTFIDESQQHVSGEIRLTLHGGRAVVTGRRSEASLYDFSLATYDEGDMFDQSLARGFVELWGLPSRLAAARDARLG